ncbi:hypothetical protein ACHAWF_002925 [Thalassiosira exigua]
MAGSLELRLAGAIYIIPTWNVGFRGNSQQLQLAVTRGHQNHVAPPLLITAPSSIPFTVFSLLLLARVVGVPRACSYLGLLLLFDPRTTSTHKAAASFHRHCHPRRTSTMARGAEGKSSRKQARKEARAKEAERILNGEGAGGDVNEFGGGMPSFEDADRKEGDESSSDDDEEESESGDDVDKVPEKTPEKKKKKSKSARARKAAASRAAAGGGGGDACCGGGGRAGGSGEGIKTLPLVMLVMLTGTTLIPALLYAGDWLSAFAAKNHLFGSFGHRLGIGPSPKKRVVSFYEKHDPDKLAEVPTILAKYYGDYPKLTKRLERKYGDYGYFINWEQDEAPMHLAIEKLWETQELMQKQFDRHAPAIVKTGARNVRHNVGFLYKKGHKLWKKTVWPTLQPYLGVPDAKAARQQKLKDKKEAEQRKKDATGQRRKSAEFRDDEDEM